MKVFLNGKELKFAEGGYEYVFTEPYSKHKSEVIEKQYGKLTIQIYDNGVQIRTLITKDEINTLINRDVRVDVANKKIYILENEE